MRRPQPITAWLAAFVVACAGANEPAPPPVPTATRDGGEHRTPAPRDAEPRDAGAPEPSADGPSPDTQTAALPKRVFPIIEVDVIDGRTVVTVGGIGTRDGFDADWRVRLVAMDNTIVPDHELVVISVRERTFVARTTVSADQIRNAYNRVQVEPRGERR